MQVVLEATGPALNDEARAILLLHVCVLRHGAGRPTGALPARQGLGCKLPPVLRLSCSTAHKIAAIADGPDLALYRAPT